MLPLLAAVVLAAPVGVVVVPFQGPDVAGASLRELQQGFHDALELGGEVRALPPPEECAGAPDGGQADGPGARCLPAPCAAAPEACATFAGAQGVVVATVTSGEAGLSARVQLFQSSAQGARIDASATFADGQRLAAWLDQEAASVRHNLEPPLQASASPGRGGRGFHLVRWIPAMVGTGCLLAGAITYGVSRGRAAELRAVARGEATLPAADIDALAARGRLEQSVGLGLVVWGLGSIALSVVWQALTREALE